MIFTLDNAEMVSGFGQHHTNEADPTKPHKALRAYERILWSRVLQLVDHPQQVDKADAQWLIPSTLLSRRFARQEQEGQFWLLWADIDKKSPGVAAVAAAIDKATGGAQREVYSSRSATTEKPKCRALIPLGQTLAGADWLLAQEVLNDLLEADQVTPDRVTQRTAQVCYLPNKGALYEVRSTRQGPLFDPLTAWAARIEAKRIALAEQAARIEADRQAAAARKTAREAMRAGSERGSLIDAFNEAHTVQDILLRAGYKQRGDTFCHPDSESGSYSASVKDRRVHSLSSSDPLYTGGGGGGAHDAFSAFTVLMHKGDRDAALRDAGGNWVMVGAESWNTVERRERAQAQTPKFGPGKQQTAADQADDDGVIPDPPQPLVQSFGQFVGARKPVVWAVQNMLQRGYIYSLTARWGHGKTAVTLPLGMHVAHGMPWAGFKVEQTRVLYLAGENPDDVRLRALKAAKVFGMDPAVLAENMFFTTRAVNLTAAEQAAMLIEQVAALGIGLCFVDTGVAHSDLEEENSNAEMHDLATALRRLSDGLAGAAVVCLMHPPKAAARDTLSTRGGGAFAGEIDGELMLWQDDATKQVELFHGTKLRGPGFKPVFFELQRHQIEDMADNFGDQVQTVVAVPVGEGTAVPRPQRMTATQRTAMQTLMRAAQEFGELNADGSLRGVHVSHWRGGFYSASTADSSHAKKVAFQRARSSLCDAGMATAADDFYRPTDPASHLVCVMAIRGRQTAQNGTVPAHVPGRAGTARHTTPKGCADVPPGEGESSEGDEPPAAMADEADGSESEVEP